MNWWQVALIILGSIIVGLLVGYGINYLVVNIAARLKKAPAPEQGTTTVVFERPKPTVPDLFTEVEANRRIATGPFTGSLISFQTQVWDTKQDEVHSLPPEVRDELTQAYFDMSLANSIVWLANEMGRRSPSLDESYSKLCTGIADRLNRIKSPIERFRLGKN